MSGLKLLIIKDDPGGGYDIGRLTQPVLASWQAETRPEVVERDMDDIFEDDEILQVTGVAWVHVTETPLGKLLELVSMMQDLHIPTLLVGRSDDRHIQAFRQDGVMVSSFGAEPNQLLAMLQSLWCMTPVMRAMENELRFLTAQQLGLCDQIDKMDEELRLAAQLQKEFLPRDLPQAGDIEFHALWRPAGYVSGDIYDVVRLDDNHIGFFVADAVGHGVPAALLTVFIRRSLPTHIPDKNAPGGIRIFEPRDAMAVLNREMVARQTKKVRFATACYGVITCDTRVVSFARAGHPYPLLLRADGTTEVLEPDGGLLGVFPEQEFEQVNFTLDKGDRLLLYSDGFEVAFPTEENGKKKIATDRYTSEFLAFRNDPAADALARLEEKLNVQEGSLNQKDDLTVICLDIAHRAAA